MVWLCDVLHHIFILIHMNIKYNYLIILHTVLLHSVLIDGIILLIYCTLTWLLLIAPLHQCCTSTAPVPGGGGLKCLMLHEVHDNLPVRFWYFLCNKWRFCTDLKQVGCWVGLRHNSNKRVCWIFKTIILWRLWILRNLARDLLSVSQVGDFAKH